LPTIEEALQIYINYYRGEPAMLRRYITLSGQLADAALWQKWLDVDERFFRAFRNLKALPRASAAFANHLATATDTKDLAINKPW
jgi:hypothetical protein